MPCLVSDSTPKHKYQDEAVTSKTLRPTPKPRSQASYHPESEEQITLMGKQTYIQDTSLYLDDAVTSKASRRVERLKVPSQSEESTFYYKK